MPWLERARDWLPPTGFTLADADTAIGLAREALGLPQGKRYYRLRDVDVNLGMSYFYAVTARDHLPRYDETGARQRRTVRRGLMDELLLARKEVLLSSPYLVPNPDVIEDIREGRLWGVTITIITNSLASTDEPLVHAGYRRYRDEMLDLGVELYEIVPSRVSRSKNLGPFGRSLGRFHAKAAAVDGQVSFIGSLNFDPRSEKHNTELGLLIRSPEVTKQLVGLAELVKTEAAYRLKLNRKTGRIEWTLPGAAGGETLTEEPDSSWWQRLLLNIVGPLVPEDHL
jgi:putative cardiolipin synthase